jgi:hypothetical protein
MSPGLRSWVVGLAVMAAPGSGQAVERVLHFHSEIRLAADGSLTVTEVILVQAEGQQLRRGIAREFAVYPFELLRVVRNGEPEPYVVERTSDGVRVRTGDAEAPLRYGRHTYEIRYRTARQVAFHDARDELRWDVSGHAWSMPLDNISAEVLLPGSAPAASLKAEAFTGPVGGTGRSYQAFTAAGSAAVRSTRPFLPREGMTIAVTFPKGLVTPPALWQRAGWFVSANLGALVAWLAALGLLAGLLYRRRRAR